MAIDDERWVVFGTPVRNSGVDGRSELAASLATIMSAGERPRIAPADVPAEWTSYRGCSVTELWFQQILFLSKHRGRVSRG